MHHTGEDTDLWPRMRAHLAGQPDELALLQAMEDERGRIDPLLDAVDDALADRDQGHQRLADTVGALTAELSGHLAHEERNTLPLMDRSQTPAEWQSFVADQRRNNGIRGAAQFFPWLLDGASAEQTQAVLAGLPTPLRVVYRRIWQPRYGPPRPLGAVHTHHFTGEGIMRTQRPAARSPTRTEMDLPRHSPSGSPPYGLVGDTPMGCPAST
jgi:hypothetical protein